MNKSNYVKSQIYGFNTYSNNNIIELVPNDEFNYTQKIPEMKKKMWVSVDARTENLEKLSYFIKQGFSHPYLTLLSPLKYQFPNLRIVLMKNYDDNKIPDCQKTEEFILKEVLYLMKHTTKMKFCSMTVRINKESKEFLNSLWMKDYHKKGDNQTEFSGIMYIINIFKEGDELVFEYMVDKKSNTKGQKEIAYVDLATANYHSHPKAAYLRKKVKYAWPSSTDFVGFYELNDVIFHCVSTEEGLYVLSYDKEWDKKNNNNKDVKNFIIDTHVLNRNHPNTIQDFLNHIHSLKFEITPKKFVRIFNVQYFTWEAFLKESFTFTVNYNKTKDTCIIKDSSMKYHEKYL